MIARRIVCDVKEGDNLNQGERFGIIRFGSRVDLYFHKVWNTGLEDLVFVCVFDGKRSH